MSLRLYELKALLAEQPDMQLAGEASNYVQAVQFVRANACDVVVADLSMPGRDGLDLLESLRTVSRSPPILVLTVHSDLEFATRAMRSGAKGFITKDATEKDLLDAIRRVAEGRTAFNHSVVEGVAVQMVVVLVINSP